MKTTRKQNLRAALGLALGLAGYSLTAFAQDAEVDPKNNLKNQTCTERIQS